MLSESPRPKHFDAVTDRSSFADRPRTVAVMVPVYNEEVGIGRTLDHLLPLLDDGLIDQLIMLDGGSTDATRQLTVERIGGHAAARAINVEDLAPEAGAVRGKGDSMWRANALVESDVVVFIDADLINVSPELPLSLAAPLVFGDEVDFTKGLFHRISDRGDAREYDGGRVTELVARPLINLVSPNLAHFYQPLSGQVAIRADLLSSLPIFTGYGVEIGMLFDISERIGIDRIGQVELGDLVNSDKSDEQLLPMAQQVTFTLLRRAGCGPVEWVPALRPTFNGEVRVVPGSSVIERPPWIDRAENPASRVG